MLEKIIQDLAKQNYLIELSSAEWLSYYKAHHEEKDHWEQQTFLKALANHTGVPLPQIITAFDPQKEPTLEILQNLCQLQKNATQRITGFQHHALFNRIDLGNLSLSRAHWNSLINKFERENRVNLTGPYFLRAVSAITRKSIESITDLMSNKKQPERGAKRIHDDETQEPAKRVARSYVKDNGINPLIYEGNQSNPALIDKLEESGVRVLPPSTLIPVTPPKGYYNTHQTPGGHKTRPVCTIDGHTFFKHLTPDHTAKTRGRVILGDVTKKQVALKMPKLLIDRAEPVSFIATLIGITERSGKMREQSQRSIAGVSSADVFRAYGVEISPTNSRSQHWSHLIAHFLTDQQEITPLGDDPDKEIVNLVPTTSAANYNTLEAVELFIRTKLVNKDTDKISIKVTPTYREDCFIPDLLVYNLNWAEGDTEKTQMNYHEVFYINPQSHCRITKTMHESINTLRAQRSKQLFDDSETDENSEPNRPRLL